MTTPTPEQLKLDSVRAASVVPDSYREDDNSIEVTFSTSKGQRTVKMDWRRMEPYVESLPMSGMTLDHVQKVEQFGLTSVPPAGQAVIVLRLHGDPDHPVAMEVPYLVSDPLPPQQ
jgi:Bacteriophage Mu Gp45 spike protein